MVDLKDFLYLHHKLLSARGLMFQIDIIYTMFRALNNFFFFVKNQISDILRLTIL